jgi:hypothetical protein
VLLIGKDYVGDHYGINKRHSTGHL